MKKKYLSDLIGEDYKNWSKKKIILTAPTGLGKTTFIIDQYLGYMRERRKKVLILCNRRLLREQYWNDLVLRFDDYNQLKERVTIMTYQQLAEQVKVTHWVEGIFSDYEAVVCDEAHYFYSDADFNGFGTYALLQAIVYAGMRKTMIFMSATTEEVKPIIKQTITNYIVRLDRTGEEWRFDSACREIVDLDYSGWADYERFKCFCVPDEETLCEKLVMSQGKSIVFIDNKEDGKILSEKLLATNKVSGRDIVVLNADNLEDEVNSEVIRNLAIANRLIPRILITTSVLDNGISVHDEAVDNVVIVTESKSSFLQMLGRVRGEFTESCNLYFLLRKEIFFLQRMNGYRKEVEAFRQLEGKNMCVKTYHYFQTVWDGADKELAEFYRKALVLAPHDFQIFTLPRGKAHGVCGDAGLYVNECARRKIGNMYFIESRFYSKAVKNPLEVIYEQLSWIGKGKEELMMLESEYIKIRESEFKEKLLSVQEFTQEQMKEFKRDLVKEFRKEFFGDILANNGTLSLEKLQSVCCRYGMKCEKSEDEETRRAKYTISLEDEKHREV